MIELISVRIIPRSAQTLAITIVVAFGSAGAALFPLIVGLVIQKHGAKALAPTLLAFLCAQICIFLLLGKPKKIAEGEAIRAME
jgi:fucose permease